MEKKDKFEFNPELELDRAEVGALTAIVSQPGFKILQRIGKACVDQFLVDWINAITDEDVLRKHLYAKTSALFYTRFIARINEEVNVYIEAQPRDTPVESGVGVDLGEHTDPNIFSEEEPLSYE